MLSIRRIGGVWGRSGLCAKSLADMDIEGKRRRWGDSIAANTDPMPGSDDAILMKPEHRLMIGQEYPFVKNWRGIPSKARAKPDGAISS